MTSRTKKYNRNNKGGSKKSMKKSKSFRLSINEKSKSSLTPSFKFIDKPSFASVIFNCKKNQSIVSNQGRMSYMDNTFDVKTSSRGGLLQGFKRMFTTTSMFLTEYIAEENNSNICFANFLPGDMFSLKINFNDKITLGSNALVCMTNNISVQTRMRLKGILTNENPFLSDVLLNKDTNQSGMVWLSSYGGYKKINLKKNEKVKINAGLFLAAQSSIRYKLGTVGGLKSTFLSGEHIMMVFEGPAEIYIQTRDINSFEHFILKHVNQNKSGGNLNDIK